MRFLPFVSAALAAAAAVHCGGSAVSTPTAADGGADAAAPSPSALAHAPSRHRPSAETCPSTRPPGTTPAVVGACQTDADCTKGRNGRCTYGPNLASVCSYDECVTDKDCGAGACDCRNEAYSGANLCFRGNCVVDADCGSGFCSPSGAALTSNCRSNVPAGAFGFFCHAAGDKCVDDVDCGEGGSCLFLPDTGHWECLEKRCTR